jgi:hypothetical protein
MSRSRRKTPIFGITGACSEKQDKRLANRVLRRKFKESVNAENEVHPAIDEVSDVWSFDKDGRP